jgi:hypothetical protein
LVNYLKTTPHKKHQNGQYNIAQYKTAFYNKNKLNENLETPPHFDQADTSILRQAQDKQLKISEEFPGGHVKLREIFVPLKYELSFVEKTGIFN